MNFLATIRGLAAASVMALSAGALEAQNLFAPVARVNDQVVTEFEVQQRQLFLQLLNAPGADRDSTIQTLIDDRLRNGAVASSGLEITPAAIQEGLEEFASQASLPAAEFIERLGQAGVDEQTFRDFVANSVGWRTLIRARFGGRATVTEDEIARALGNTRSAGEGIRVLLSEIIIPAPPPQAARVNALAARIAQSQTEAEFSNFASQHSATASRGRGGRMPWTPLDQLPPTLHPIILALGVGEVTVPLPIPNAVALFQLRGIEETSAPTPTYSQVEYAAYYIAGGRSPEALEAAARLRNEVDVCNDLYAVAQGQPEDVLERGTLAPADIPQDIAFELSKLDPGEVSTALTRAQGQTLVFLMLCSRTAEINEGATDEDVIGALRQRKLQGFADVLMEQLRANARIIRQ